MATRNLLKRGLSGVLFSSCVEGSCDAGLLTEIDMKYDKLYFLKVGNQCIPSFIEFVVDTKKCAFSKSFGGIK